MCNTRVRRFVRVFVDLSDTEQDERFLQLEATARNLEIELDVLHFTESERIRQLEKELNDKSVEVATALSNVQHFFHKVAARDEEIRGLKVELNERGAEMEELRSNLQRLTQQLEEQIRRDNEASSSARVLAEQINGRDKIIRQLKAELKKKDQVWKIENELLHAIISLSRLLFSVLEIMLLFLWIFDCGNEEVARHTVLNMLTAVVFVVGLLLDSDPALKALTTSWAVMTISRAFVATN